MQSLERCLISPLVYFFRPCHCQDDEEIKKRINRSMMMNVESGESTTEKVEGG